MSSLQSHLVDDDDDGQESLGSRDDHVTDSPGAGGGFSDHHPPESFWVSDQDWFYRNAATVERKASKKLTVSGGSGHHRRKSSLSSSSNRKRNFSLIALPAGQKCRPAVDGNFRRGNAGLFRSWSDPGGKVAVRASEPGSPVVTCTGKVRRKKGGGGRTGLVKWFGNFFRTGFGKNRA